MPSAQRPVSSGRNQQRHKLLMENVARAMDEVLGPLRQPVWVIANEAPHSGRSVKKGPVRAAVL